MLQCDTKDQHPQTYDANVARGYYFTKKYGDLHGVYVFSSDSKAGHDDQFASGSAACATSAAWDKGIRSDARRRPVRRPPNRASTRPSSRR